jgi:hypothetical protein
MPHHYRPENSHLNVLHVWKQNGVLGRTVTVSPQIVIAYSYRSHVKKGIGLFPHPVRNLAFTVYFFCFPALILGL